MPARVKPRGSRYSAVLIAYNEEKNITQSINSLLSQSVPPYRVVVVDDGSTDKTTAILRKLGVDVVTLPPHNESKMHSSKLAEVRNSGYKEIRQDPVDWIYSGDTDIILPSRYCETLMQVATETDVYVGGSLPSKRNIMPIEGHCMMRARWFNHVDTRTNQESIYLGLTALDSGYNSLVIYSPFCIVNELRTSGSNYRHAKMSYRYGWVQRRAGLAWYFLPARIYRHAKHYGSCSCLQFFKGYCATQPWKKSMAVIYTKLEWQRYLAKFFHWHNVYMDITKEHCRITPPRKRGELCLPA